MRLLAFFIIITLPFFSACSSRNEPGPSFNDPVLNGSGLEIIDVSSGMRYDGSFFICFIEKKKQSIHCTDQQLSRKLANFQGQFVSLETSGVLCAINSLGRLFCAARTEEPGNSWISAANASITVFSTKPHALTMVMGGLCAMTKQGKSECFINNIAPAMPDLSTFIDLSQILYFPDGSFFGIKETQGLVRAHQGAKMVDQPGTSTEKYLGLAYVKWSKPNLPPAFFGLKSDNTVEVVTGNPASLPSGIPPLESIVGMGKSTGSNTSICGIRVDNKEIYCSNPNDAGAYQGVAYLKLDASTAGNGVVCGVTTKHKINCFGVSDELPMIPEGLRITP